MIQGKVKYVCSSSRRGPKHRVDEIHLVRGHGISGDVHAGNWHRQVSLLAEEDIDYMRSKGLELEPGAFGENIVTEGLDLLDLQVGRRFYVGEHAVLQITQHGKHCPAPCVIFYKTGECIMPNKGVFARVLRSGTVKSGDELRTADELDEVRFAVLTLSDKGASGQREDTSGPLVVDMLSSAIKGSLVVQEILPDDRESIEDRLKDLADEQICDLIVTTGGTGLSPRDVTPDATLAVVDRLIPGMAEAMRLEGLEHTPHAMLSRAVCGQRGQTIIVNLSGSPKAVEEQLSVLLPALPHALQTATGIPQDCARR